MSAGSPEGVSSHGVSRGGAEASSRVAVQVDYRVPLGIPRPSVLLTFEPATADEFDATVEALGGVKDFGVLTGFAFKNLGTFMAHVMVPKSEQLSSMTRLDPFMDRFLSRVQAAGEAA